METQCGRKQFNSFANFPSSTQQQEEKERRNSLSAFVTHAHTPAHIL